MKLAGGILREMLKNDAPELHAILEHQWEIALNEWLSAIKPASDSCNSFPHLRNVERYAGELILNTTVNPPILRFNFSNFEIYLLLASVLFHDIGKSIEDNQKERKKEHPTIIVNDHGTIAKSLILKDWAKLGFTNYQVANAVGKICAFHECKNPKSEIEILTVDIIDPLGPANIKSLSAILYIADKMDCSFTRIPPDYMRAPDSPRQAPRRIPHLHTWHHRQS